MVIDVTSHVTLNAKFEWNRKGPSRISGVCVVLLIPICPEVWQGWGRGKLIKAFPGEVRRPISGWLSLRPHLAHHSLRKVKSPEIPSSSTW